MTLTQLSIKRYVFAFMLNAVLVLFGLISYQRLGVDRFPYIEFPVISITTTLKGAHPNSVDSSITNPIESSVNSVPGIEHIQSTSSNGASVISVTFNLDKNIDVAFNEVQAKVNQVLRVLPDEVDPPIVAKVETNAQPILWLALSGDRTLQQLNLYAKNVLKKKLETIDGVGEVRLGGRRDRTIRVQLDPMKMAAFGITTKDITDAFRREHVQLPGGFVVNKTTEYLMKLDLEFHQIDALKTLIILQRNGLPIRLKDIGDVTDDLADFRQLARFKGAPSVGIGIVKISNANTVAIVDAIQAKLDKEIIPTLPAGLTIQVASNTALFIQDMVDALKEHLFEGTLLTAIVVWIFLRSVRSTIIISLAIPVSLLGAVAVLYFGGFTFNTMTLLALLLLIGVVVDDAIVVLENIYRHREDLDPDPITSAINGSQEVVFAVLAATMSLVAIFAPVIFMDGIIGKFFKSFAVVVTFGVLVSLFVSLTLTPMLCSRFLTMNKKHGAIYHLLDRFFDGLDRFYHHLLQISLHHRWKVIVMTLMMVGSSGYFFSHIGKEFAPEEDEGRFLISLRTPLGSSIEYTNARLQEVENIVKKHKEVAAYFASIGSGQANQVNQASMSVRLVPMDQRTVSQSTLLKQLRQELSTLAGVKAFPAPVPLIGGQRGEPLQFVLTGPNLNDLEKYAQQLHQNLQTKGVFGRIDMDLQLDLPQLTLKIDRERAAVFGLETDQIAETYNVLTGGKDIAKYNDDPGDGERYDIRIKAHDYAFKQPTDLANVYLRNKSGDLIRLDNVARFEENAGPAVISRYDLQYSVTYYATPTIPLGEAATVLKNTAETILPVGYKTRLIGQAEEFGKTVYYMGFAFGLALILLYMVLASQFNSFIQPVIIMLAQPLAIIGGIFGLWVGGQTLNIYSMIGLVLLVGLVAKNSILLVDLTNQYRLHKKMSINEALKAACPIRLRPVIMTSMTLILALLPAALGLGAGAGTNKPLAIAVIGGMISSTLLTLIVVPSVYSLIEHRLERWSRRHSLTISD